MSTSRSAQLQRFEGIMALLLTPFTPDKEIDWKTYDAYLDWQLSHKPHGLFAVCGTSEMKWLALEERLELARRAVARAGGTPVVATANLEPDINHHRDEMLRMIDTGVAGIVLVPPAGLGCDQTRLRDYFAALADASSRPVFLYEWPQVDPYFIEPDVFRYLVEHHGVFGIKDTTCTLDGIRAKVQAAPDAIVYQANTPFSLASLDIGARGIMAITSAACADLVVRFWKLATCRAPDAPEIHAKLVFLDAVLRAAHPATSKFLAALRGLPMPVTCRWPVTLHPELVQAVSIWYERSCLADRSQADSLRTQAREGWG